MEGLGGIADIVGTPLNMLINRATGSNLGTPSQSMSNIATMLGLPQPQTGLEKGVANVARAVAGVPAMGGLGGVLQQSGRAVTQAVGQGLAAQVYQDLVVQASPVSLGGLGFPDLAVTRVSLAQRLPQ
jgi:hypothetical protein